MIVFFENGRIGNQLFQYCAMRKLNEECSLYFIGMQSLKSMFDGTEIAGATKLERVIERMFCCIGRNWLTVLAKKVRLIGFIEEHMTPTDPIIELTNGLLNSVYFCGTSFFQSEKFVEESVAGKLQVKPQLLMQASNIFMNFPCDRTETFFVHIRRGDYICWPSKSTPAVLPSKWYLEQMDEIRANYVNPFFVVVSDDGPYVDEVFSVYKDVFVAHESEELDFALMSLCDGGGILSASSFSWWAAYFARRNGAMNFIAPLYWAGHRCGAWLPIGIKTSWLKYAVVS